MHVRSIHPSSTPSRQRCAEAVPSLSTIASEAAVFSQALKALRSGKKVSRDEPSTTSATLQLPYQHWCQLRYGRTIQSNTSLSRHSRSRRSSHSLDPSILPLTHRSEGDQIANENALCILPAALRLGKGLLRSSIILRMHQARQSHSVSRLDVCGLVGAEVEDYQDLNTLATRADATACHGSKVIRSAKL